jgi:outer membrane immunogenic protein
MRASVKCVVALFGISTLLFSTANAADLPNRPAYQAPAIVPVYNWTGFYVGVEGGGAWGSTRHDFTVGSHGSFDVNGGLAGGTLGYNYQMGQFLAGIEGDISWASIHGSAVGTPTPCTGGPCTSKLTWLSTVRGRLGYVAGNWMPYATGGVAFGNVDACENVTCSSATYTGWTAGGGLEATFAPNWSVKVEYLYADLGSHNAYFLFVPHTVDFKTNILRAGLNYKFN